MATISGSTSPSSDAEELRKFLDNFESGPPESERLVLFRDKDGQVHVISKKINRFEGLWAKIGLSKMLQKGFGMIDANIKHVLQHLNEKGVADPRLIKFVQRYNAKRRFGKIKAKDYPNLFPRSSDE